MKIKMIPLRTYTVNSVQENTFKVVGFFTPSFSQEPFAYFKVFFFIFLLKILLARFGRLPRQ